MKLPDISFAIGRYWIYNSRKSHWILPLSKDENGVWFGSLGYIKIIRYPYKESNPEYRKKIKG